MAMEDRATRYIGIGLVILVIAIGYGMLNTPERTRPLSYDKGVYSGQPDQKLDKKTLDTLRQRALRSGNSGI